ncbi:hypothetical protein LXA43DRAFT_1065055 [Ganoderma leucocontextum]|nr:hypothetical protein LXA43DRAFT_1066366 [Ganoderma leucocontextum]KAI1786482.1 hypothetical protein LXA43DRAFT_1065055 [Ganoderma leucocontextum]
MATLSESLLSMLPTEPVDCDLDDFIHSLYKPDYPYDIACALDIISSFLDLVRPIPMLYTPFDCDPYFMWVVKFLADQPEGQRPSIDFLEGFYNQYVRLSRKMCLEQNTAKLEVAEDAHRKATDNYRKVNVATLCDKMKVCHPAYQDAAVTYAKTLKSVRKYQRRTERAAQFSNVLSSVWGADPADDAKLFVLSYWNWPG